MYSKMQTRIENDYRVYTYLRYKFNCIVCGDEFKCRSISAKYCSQRCKNDRSIENRKIQATNKRNSSNTCKICSIILIQNDKNKVKLYCSSKCKQKAYRNKVTQKSKVI